MGLTFFLIESDLEKNIFVALVSEWLEQENVIKKIFQIFDKNITVITVVTTILLCKFDYENLLCVID